MSKKIRLVMLLLVALSLPACQSMSMRKISKDYQTITGTLAAAPTYERAEKRLVLYIHPDPQEEGQPSKVLVCVATNKERHALLKGLAHKIQVSDRKVVLYGKPVDGMWEEYLEGIDFEMVAVGYYDPAGDRYMMAITTYGDKVLDVLRSMGWSSFMKTLIKQGIKSL